LAEIAWVGGSRREKYCSAKRIIAHTKKWGERPVDLDSGIWKIS
jgi:hypothetical protein